MLSLLIATSLLAFQLERPHITLAQGLVESNLNPYAIGKVKEKGAWQVIEKEWGRVPKGMDKQALQNEKILNELLEDSNQNLFEALVKYNSYKNRKAGVKYARKVRRTAIEVSLIDYL